MDAELKPCPFCGSSDITVERLGTSRQSCIVVCENCGCGLSSNANGAGDAWNRRAPEAAVQGPTREGSEHFKAALVAYLKDHDWQPNQAERIEGFSAGWNAHRGAANGELRMGNCNIEFTEWRFIIEPELLQVYVVIEMWGDCPHFGVQGWHHKTFAKSVSVMDVLERMAKGKEDPLLWSQQAPDSARSAGEGETDGQ